MTFMNHKPRVDLSAVLDFDADGALQETAAEAQRHSRRAFLRRGGIAAGGAVAAAGVVPGLTSGAMAATPKGDVAIANFALTLEYLESAFYASRDEARRPDRRAQAPGADRPPTRPRTSTALKKMLGSAAVKRPSFDFGSAVQSQAAFTQTAITLEDTGVQAYQGQAAFIKSQAVFKAALSIHPVEARHAAWIRKIGGTSPRPPRSTRR